MTFGENLSFFLFYFRPTKSIYWGFEIYLTFVAIICIGHHRFYLLGFFHLIKKPNEEEEEINFKLCVFVESRGLVEIDLRNTDLSFRIRKLQVLIQQSEADIIVQ